MWGAHLDLLAVSALKDLLDAAERQRAARFVRAEDARRFIARRAIAKLVLSDYVGQPAGELSFDTTCRHCGGDHGKPRLAAHRRLDFSWTARDDVFLLAVATDRRVGIDIEGVEESSSDWRDVAEEALGDRELAALAAMAESDRLRVAMRAWSAKEALLKAVGLGLAWDLRSLEVTIEPVAAPRLVGGMPPSSEEHWSLREISAGPDHVSMLAVSGPPPDVMVRQFEALDIHPT